MRYLRGFNSYICLPAAASLPTAALRLPAAAIAGGGLPAAADGGVALAGGGVALADGGDCACRRRRLSICTLAEAKLLA